MNSSIKLSAAACSKLKQIVIGKAPTITGARCSRWETYVVVQENFEKIQEWITEYQNLDICKNSTVTLAEIVYADESRDKLMIS